MAESSRWVEVQTMFGRVTSAVLASSMPSILAEGEPSLLVAGDEILLLTAVEDSFLEGDNDAGGAWASG